MDTGSHMNEQTITEQQNITENVEMANVDEQSDSDNEEIEDIEAVVVNKFDDEELERTESCNFKVISEEGSDDVDHEIANILHDAEPLGLSEKIKSEFKTFEVTVVHEPSAESTLETKTLPNIENDLTEESAQKVSHTQEIKHEASEINESKNVEETIENDSMNVSTQETLIDDELQKPPVPIKTYQWEEIKRMKEHGGYPWTHITKGPYSDELPPISYSTPQSIADRSIDDDPQSILSYKQSPRAARKVSIEEGSPKVQKKVRIQDEVQDFDVPEIADDTEFGEIEKNEEIVAETSKPSKSILKQSQYPEICNVDSGSLKKKIKNPLQKMKKMADLQFQKVKSRVTHSVPVRKDEISKEPIKSTNEFLQILDLKQSPKSQHRDIPAYVEEDSVEILELTESPNPRRREVETHVLSVNETSQEKIIDDELLPGAETVVKVPAETAVQTESTSEGLKNEVPVTPKKRDHVYEDIDQYISRISDIENVERNEFQQNPKLKHQDVEIVEMSPIEDPMFDEFSREQNKKIRRSLTHQDHGHEIIKNIVKMDEMEKLSFEEDKHSMSLLAPIASIDSTSSEEDRTLKLSAVAEDDGSEKVSLIEDEVKVQQPEDIFKTVVFKPEKQELKTAINETVSSLDIGSVKAQEESLIDDQDVKEDVTVKTLIDDQAVKGDVTVKTAKVSQRWSKMSDHEYEPIGQSTNPNPEVQVETQKSTSEEQKFESDAQDFQDDIEVRFFRNEIEPIAKENTLDEAVIIDESPVKRKRNFIATAQESGKNLHKKIKAQAGNLKNTLSTKLKKKPVEENPLAVEFIEEGIVAREDTEIIRETTVETVTIEASGTSPKKAFKMPNFIKRSTLSKKTESLQQPIENPDNPEPRKSCDRFLNFRKLGRSKSLKEESVLTDEATVDSKEVKKTRKFDFGTYPRFIKNKLKKSKVSERSDQSLASEEAPSLGFVNTSTTFFAHRNGQEVEQKNKYNSESDLNSESSIEKRMREVYERSTEEREDFEIVKRLMNEEQRQMDEMEKENQEIHLMAQQERYKKVIERQESDEDKLLWSGMLNEDQSKATFDINALKFEDYKFSLEPPNMDANRSYTPQTNQETQSSGSSGTRRLKGVFDDEECDDYFSRKNISVKEDHHIGDYISSAIKEGLSSPEENVLAHMGSYDSSSENVASPEKPTRSLKRDNKKKENINKKTTDIGKFYRTYPTSTKSNQESFEDEHFKETEEAPDSFIDEDFNQSLEYNRVPPTPPTRRRKKIIRSLHSENLRNDNEQLEKPFKVLAPEENFPIIAAPRRIRSRSQISSHTLDDAESFKKDSIEAFAMFEAATEFNNQDKENAYAQVKKDLPARPVRRKRSVKSLGDSHFATMPHLKHESPPARPFKKYSTIIPHKPPRRKSEASLDEISIPNDYEDDYEEILDQDNSHRLQSGAIVRKMKERPLPPPPRPKREAKKPKKDDNDKFDRGAERILELEDTQENLPRQDSGELSADFSEKLFEGDDLMLRDLDTQEMCTQTDPVPEEDFVCDDEVDDASDSKMKTLEDILKEEQEAEFERARQLAEAESLSRGIQRFRESSQRSLSERSRASAGGHSRSSSRPITPSVVLVERKKSSPIIFENQPQTLTEIGLFIHPITFDDFGQHVSTDANEAAEVTEDYEFDEEMKKKLDEMIDSVILCATEESDLIRANAKEEPKEEEPMDEEPNEAFKSSDIAETLPQLPPRRKKPEPIADTNSNERELDTQEFFRHIQTSPRLHLSNLEIDSLSCGRINASEIDSNSIVTNEFECKTSLNLTNTIDFPPGFIEQIVERVRSAEQHAVGGESHHAGNTEHENFESVQPLRFDYPSTIPPSFYNLKNDSEEETAHPQTPQRRRRHQKKRKDSASEDEPRERRGPSALTLGGQFARACGNSIWESGDQLMAILRASSKDENRRDLHIALIILIVIVAGLILMGITEKPSVHHHHWDFFNPPTS